MSHTRSKHTFRWGIYLLLYVFDTNFPLMLIKVKPISFDVRAKLHTKLFPFQAQHIYTRNLYSAKIAVDYVI